MKLPRWSGLALLLLQLSCVSLPKMSAQQGGAEVAPPQAMRVCINASPVGCENLTWTGELYEGRADNSKEISSRYWINEWTSAHIDLTIKSRKGGDGVFPLDGKMTGAMPVLGGHGVSGTLNWQIGYSKSGATTFVLTWPKTASSAAAVSDLSVYTPARRSVTHPNITLPPGAAEEFASFPDYMRAVLQPEHPLPPTLAKLPCGAAGSVSDVDALEIGKSAFRRAEFDRGYCWLKRSAALGNVRAEVLLGTSALMGWGVPRNESAAFRIFTDTDGKKDLWNAWFLEKCYMEGLGTPVDRKMAGRIDAYLMMRNAGQELFLSVGSDDLEVRKAVARADLYSNPPTTSKQVCQQVIGGQHCEPVSVVDDKELQRRLNQIDGQR